MGTPQRAAWLRDRTVDEHPPAAVCGSVVSGYAIIVPVSTTLLKLFLPAVPSSVRTARDAVVSVVDELDPGDGVVDDVRLCVSEAVTNIVRHAYRGRPRGDVALRVERKAGTLVVVVRDEGIGISASRGRTGTGGYGLRIIERIARRCTITSRRGAGTELRMAFALPPAQAAG
jgi:anti-sigma regulatory factor (Ser/Thr protein kinase)